MAADIFEKVEGAIDVGAQVAAAAVLRGYHEVTERPAATFTALAESVAIGTVSVATAPALTALGARAAVVGAFRAAGDMAIIGLTAASLSSAVVDNEKAASQMGDSVDVLMHKSAHRLAEVEQARLEIREKAGGAALEALGAAAMTMGSLKAGLHLQSKIFDAPEKNLPELELTEQTKLCPSGAVARFSDRLADFLGERNNLVDMYALPDHQLHAEFEVRRNGLAKIINAEKKELFFEEVVPTLRIQGMPAGEAAEARYQRGVIELKDSDLIDGGRDYRITNGDRLSANILHEVKHAEQDGLILRHAIDIVTSNNKSGRPLSKSEMTRVANIFEGKSLDAELEAIIKDVNLQRAGRPLGGAQIERAKSLRQSQEEAEKLMPSHDLEAQRLGTLQNDYMLLQKNPAAAKEHFARLLAEMRSSEELCRKHYKTYRSWKHEVEAWAVSENAQKNLSRPIIKPQFAHLPRALFAD